MQELMLGNQAIARGAYEAGVVVASAYPGTPSTEITEFMAKYDDVYSEWAPNEKVALEVAIGASISGARAMCAMKHVGLNVAADPLYTASYTGVNGGLVICVADDPGMHSSQNEQDSRRTAVGSKTVMLEPADSGECKEFMKKAFEISEEFDTPVLMRLTTRVAHSQSLVSLCDREEHKKEYAKNPAKYVMMPAMAIKRHVVVEERLKALSRYAESCDLNRVEKGGNIGVIASGAVYQYAKEALGDKASYLKLGMVYPLPEKLICDFVSSVDVCYVLEELEPFFEEFCKQLGCKVIGKEKFSLMGEYSVNQIKSVILGEEAEGALTISEPIPNRPPVMCAGCPHRGTFYVLSKLGLTVTGDIGCYTLGALPPLASVDACVCMGASIGMSHGMDKGFGNSKKTVAVLGDSTFIHSGITGLIDIVYNKGNATVIILDNSITGMTGHQDNPTTGKTIKGEPTRQVDLEKLCHAVGVDRVVIADPFDLAHFEEVVKGELEAEEPSVIIAQRPCALLKTVKYTGKMIINDKCKNCKMCMKLGCPAIAIKDGRPTIDKNQCNGCGLCKNVCKFGAMEKVGE